MARIDIAVIDQSDLRDYNVKPDVSHTKREPFPYDFLWKAYNHLKDTIIRTKGIIQDAEYLAKSDNANQGKNNIIIKSLDNLEQFDCNVLNIYLCESDKSFLNKIERESCAHGFDSQNLLEKFNKYKENRSTTQENKNIVTYGNSSDTIDELSRVSLVALDLKFIDFYSKLSKLVAEVVKAQLDKLKEAQALISSLIAIVNELRVQLNNKFTDIKSKDVEDKKGQPRPDWIDVVDGDNKVKFNNFPENLKPFFNMNGNKDKDVLVNKDEMLAGMELVMIRAGSSIQFDSQITIGFENSEMGEKIVDNGKIFVKKSGSGIFGPEESLNAINKSLEAFLENIKNIITSVSMKMPDMSDILKNLESLLLNTTLPSVK